MLAVTVEVWPGGDRLRPRRIAMIGAANLSDVADVSDYAAVLLIDSQPVGTAHVVGHLRADGPLELIRRILDRAVTDMDAIDHDIRNALIERLEE